MENEIFKPIPNYYEYEVSNLGRVKSLKFGNEKILKATLNHEGYKRVGLYKNKKQKYFKVHQLVAMAFLGHTPNGHTMVVNHIDHNRVNNNIDNIEIVTARANSSHKKVKGSSNYTGVSFVISRGRWSAGIKINGKSIFLGYFDSEIEASNAYQNALLNHNQKLGIYETN